MSRTSEILQKAQSLRQKHQEDIDSELKNGIRLALDDTKSFVKQRANTILKDMEMEIEKVETDLTQNLQNQKTEMQSKIGKVANNFNSNTQALNTDLQKQIQDMNQHLQTLQSLSQATVEQVKIKKILISSNIVLSSIALILLISSISFAYVSKSKYEDINEMQKKVEYLKSQGGSMNISQCGDPKTAKLCVQVDPTSPAYKNNFVVVQETN